MQHPELIIERLDPLVPMPKYAREGDSGMDLCAWPDEDGGELCHPGEVLKMPTALRAQIPEGYEIQIRPRSGYATNYKIVPINSPGTIDSGYRGEWFIPVINHGESTVLVNRGDKIAHAVLVPVTQAIIVEGVVSNDTERCEAGFGSTGR